MIEKRDDEGYEIDTAAGGGDYEESPVEEAVEETGEANPTPG